jgi:SAM-dependent methyltransferase
MNYRGFVGSDDNYDLVGAMQFNLLTALGLREYHKFLDIGCGSLRAGRLFIPYLNRGCYCGIEPEKWLVEAGIKNEIGEKMVEIKAPRFEYSYEFPVDSFGEKFDYMVAHSIFSHASQEQILQCLKKVKLYLAPSADNKRGGLLAATFILADSDYEGKEWVYPGKDDIGFARYTEECIYRIARESELAYKKLDYPHQNVQTWFIFGNKNDIEQADDPTYNLKKMFGK